MVAKEKREEMISEEGTKHGEGRPKKPVKKQTVTGVRFSKFNFFESNTKLKKRIRDHSRHKTNGFNRAGDFQDK